MHPNDDDAWHENPRAWPDRAIANVAERQGTMITTAQLHALGVSTRMITKALRRARLHAVHRGVYSLVGPRARPPLAAEQAAVLACGPHAVLSHHSAAKLHGLRLPSLIAEVHVTTIAGSHRRAPRNVVVHRTATLHPQEHIRVERLPVTSVARTLIDLAPLLTEAVLEPLIDQALRKTSRTKLTEALDRHRRRPGTPRMRRLLDPGRPSADAWSRSEARLLAAIRRAGLPSPEANVALGGYFPDLLWREQRLIVEYDSYDFHSGPAAFHNDRTRHNELTAHGRHQILHVTRRQVAEELERVLVWIAVALARGER